MGYATFHERVEDVSSRLKKLSKMQNLGLSPAEISRLQELAAYAQGMADSLDKGGTLDYKSVHLVETLEKALDMVLKDGEIKKGEVKKLIAISEDLVISDEELQELEKEGESG